MLVDTSSYNYYILICRNATQRNATQHNIFFYNIKITKEKMSNLTTTTAPCEAHAAPTPSGARE